MGFSYVEVLKYIYWGFYYEINNKCMVKENFVVLWNIVNILFFVWILLEGVK